MSDTRYKTLCHIENVRNLLNAVVYEFLRRGEVHDQTKLKTPEVEIFEEFTPKLKNITYGSEEYHECLRKMKPALDHHYANNRHHPEYFKNGIDDMNLFDILEMLVDWKASSMRHEDDDIYKSIELNQKRFGYSDQFKKMLINTMDYLEKKTHIHKE